MPDSKVKKIPATFEGSTELGEHGYAIDVAQTVVFLWPSPVSVKALARVHQVTYFCCSIF